MKIDPIKIYKKVKTKGIQFSLEECEEVPNFEKEIKECPECGAKFIKKPLHSLYIEKDNGFIVGERVQSEDSPYYGAFVITNKVEDWVWTCTKCMNSESVKTEVPEIEELSN